MGRRGKGKMPVEARLTFVSPTIFSYIYEHIVINGAIK